MGGSDGDDCGEPWLTYLPKFLNDLDIGQGENELEVNVNAYCMKCKTKREIRNPQQITMKNGRPATTGVCSTCGTKVFRIGKS